MSAALAHRCTAHRLNDMKDLDGYVTKYAATGVDRIVIEGGDGTVQGVMTAFISRRDSFEKFPEFSIVAGGMTNQIARNVGIMKPNPRTINRLLRGSDGTLKNVSLLHVSPHGMPDLHGFLFSTGAVPYATDYVKSHVHRRGIGGGVAVFWTIIKGVLSSGRARNALMPPSMISVILKGGQQAQTHISENHLGTLVTTLPGLMLNIDPFWGKADAPVRVTYVGAGAKKLFIHMLSLWRGRKQVDRSDDQMESYNVNSVEFDYKGPCLLDGERVFLRDDKVTIQASAPVTFVT